MAGRFQNQKGMNLLRHAQDVVNSTIKRDKKNAYPTLVICGCSSDCGFARIEENKMHFTCAECCANKIECRHKGLHMHPEDCNKLK